MFTKIRGETQLKEWGDIILSSFSSNGHTRMKSGYMPVDEK